MYGFMRSGLAEGDTSDAAQVDFMRKTAALMKVLMEESARTGARLAQVCGRSVVTDDDLKHALMYEAHHFWQKDFDQRFFAALEDEQHHTYLTDEETDEASDDETDKASDDETDEATDEATSETASGDKGEEGGAAAAGDEDPYAKYDRDAYELVSTEWADATFYNEVMRIKAEWPTFAPEDPVVKIVKRAVDNC